jgi:hypothetical protein
MAIFNSYVKLPEGNGNIMPYRPSDLVVPKKLPKKGAGESRRGCTQWLCSQVWQRRGWTSMGPWAALREWFKGSSCKGMLNIRNGGNPANFPFIHFRDLEQWIQSFPMSANTLALEVPKFESGGLIMTSTHLNWEISSDALHPPIA